MSERLYKKEAVRRTLRVSLATLDRLIQHGELPVVRVGRRAIRVSESAIAALIQRGTERREERIHSKAREQTSRRAGPEAR